MTRYVVWGGALLACLGFGHSTASAQAAQPRCFGGEAVASAPVVLGDRIQLDVDCEYSRDPDEGFRTLRDRGSITSLLAGLGWNPGDQTTVYGRRRDLPAEVSSVFLHHCTDYLLQAGGAFSVAPAATPGALDVRRRAASCGAASVALQFTCRNSREGLTAQLAPGADTVSLPVCQAGWDVQASAAGQPPYALGRVAPGGETPLQAAMRAENTTLLRPSWDGERGFRFVPAGDDDVWAELRTALAAGAVRVVRKRGATPRTACDDETAEEIPLVVTAGGVAFDEGWLAGRMNEQYGENGTRFAPTLGWLQALANESHLCMNASYGARGGASQGGAEPQRGAQTHIGRSFPEVAAVASIGERFATAEVCLTHRRVDVTPSGQVPRTDRDHDVECAPAPETPLFVGLTGSSLRIPDGTVICSGRETVEAGPLTRGFYDVRVATQGACAAPATVSLGRVGIVDAGVDWIPRGVQRHSNGADAGDIPGWQGVQVDDPNTFARSRRNDALTFELATPEGFAAAWNHPSTGAPTLLSRATPYVGASAGPGHSPLPAMYTMITADPECPLSGEPTLRGAGESGPDEVVHVHLISDDGRGKRCLARAAFKSWDPRVVGNVGNSDRRQLRIGFLGHASLGVFFSKPSPAAIGIALPIFYTDLHLNAGFVFELSVPVTASIAWEDGRASRVSPALMASMSWGWPEIAPRLITAGFAIHVPWPHPDDEVYSFFVGVDITSLIELLGGR